MVVMAESTQRKYLTHRSTDDSTDYEYMSLKAMPGEGGVRVFFDKNASDDTNMPGGVYDSLCDSDEWEEIGFVEI